MLSGPALDPGVCGGWESQPPVPVTYRNRRIKTGGVDSTQPHVLLVGIGTGVPIRHPRVEVTVYQNLGHCTER